MACCPYLDVTFCIIATWMMNVLGRGGFQSDSPKLNGWNLRMLMSIPSFLQNPFFVGFMQNLTDMRDNDRHAIAFHAHLGIMGIMTPQCHATLNHYQYSQSP